MYKCSWHGSLLLFGLQGSHLNSCYYHQDLHQSQLHLTSLSSFKANPAPSYSYYLTIVIDSMAEHRWQAWAPSIFRASSFGRWVVTHSLAGFDFHDHRPAVWMNQHLLWVLMSLYLGTVAQRSVQPASPVLLTKNGPLGFLYSFPHYNQASEGSYQFRVWE